MAILKMNRLRKGVALITAMMIMSLATIVAVQMTSDQQVYFRRTENILLHEQAYQYLLSAEDFAKIVLSEDFKDNNTDSYKDAWHSDETVVYPVEGGALTGSIFDLQGKFNINNLSKAKRDPWDEERLNQLLQNNNLSPEIASVIIDWLDQDPNAQPGGAEDVDYLAGEQPYRAGNGMMASISELKLLKGIDDETYRVLERVLVALPADNVAININTAPPEVLRVIVPGLDETGAEDLAKDLADNPLKDPDDLLNHGLVRGNKVNLNGLSVESSYFLVESIATVGRARAKLRSIIFRQSDKNINIVMRSQGEL